MDSLDEVMAEMNERWRYRWCDPGPLPAACACVGCANIAGKLRALGFTREDWAEWVKRNPGSK